MNAETSRGRPSEVGSGPEPRLRWESWLLFGLVTAKLVLQLGLDRGYGYFRDEFYYMNLGERMWEGPTAMPILAPLLMAGTLQFLGDSLTALHVLPAVAGALVIFITVRMVREWGGSVSAQGLAGVCTLLAPINVGINSTFSYDSFDQLWWVLSLYVIIRILKTDNPRYWVWFGVTTGLGLLTKETMLFLGFAVAVAVAVTGRARDYLGRWIWVGAALSLLGFAPYLVMQHVLGWPLLEYFGKYSSEKTYPVSPVEFILFQIFIMNPLASPVWLAGLWYLGAHPEGKRYRALAMVYVILLVMFILLRTKFYFLAPVYAVLFAAGATFLSRMDWVQKRASWARAYAGLMVATGILLASYAMPLLPIDQFIRIASRTGGDLGVKQERHALRVLPQHFADRFGWEEMAKEIIRVCGTLSPEDRARACIFTGNYGEAGAIEFFGRKWDPQLPPVLSGHGQHFIWGPGDATGEVMIVLGVSEKELRNAFSSVLEVGRTHSDLAMLYEDDRPIYICRGIREPLSTLWREVGRFD